MCNVTFPSPDVCLRFQKRKEAVIFAVRYRHGVALKEKYLPPVGNVLKVITGWITAGTACVPGMKPPPDIDMRRIGRA